MASSRTSSSRRPIKKGGMFLPALCNIIGTLILVAVIATSVPLAIPRFLGYETYNVTSGSMEPALPVGSVIYVQYVEPATVQPGEIIAYNVDGTVITHRVVENWFVEGEFVTKHRVLRCHVQHAGRGVPAAGGGEIPHPGGALGKTAGGTRESGAGRDQKTARHVKQYAPANRPGRGLFCQKWSHI